MKRSLLLIAVVCLLLAFGAGRLLAHEEDWTTTFSSLDQQVFVHNDDEPYKGWAKLTVYNDTSDYWTDFHFKITSVNGSDISGTYFVDGMQGQINCDPTSSQSGLSCVINNNPAGGTMDLYFLSDPVAPGAEAWFKVYTDNTTNKVQFGLCTYPTIPEPGSMLALLSGIVGLGGFALRKRS